MTLTVTILNWNCEEFIENCIDSVLGQTYSQIEVKIIDNDSSDGSIKRIRTRFPDIPLIINPRNLGFAKAHNMAIRNSKSKYYMPLNPDVILTKDFVDIMINCLEVEKDNQVGAVTGKVYFLDPDGTPTRRIYTTGHLLTRNRKQANRGYKREDIGQFEKKDYVFGVNGACPIFSRQMLEDVAFDGEYFDEDFFLYGDDYDLGWRSQLFGWKSIYVPSAVAYHFGKGSGGLNSSYIQFQYARNGYMGIYKNDLTIHFLKDLPFIILYELLWQGYTILTNPRRIIEHLRAIISFLNELPNTRRKRRMIQARRRVSKQYIRSLFSGVTFR